MLRILLPPIAELRLPVVRAVANGLRAAQRRVFHPFAHRGVFVALQRGERFAYDRPRAARAQKAPAVKLRLPSVWRLKAPAARASCMRGRGGCGGGGGRADRRMAPEAP